jgi:hypothetical protein
VFQLTVTDNQGASSSDQVTITVFGNNQPPAVNAGSDQVASATKVVTLSGSGSDPDGDPITFSWTQVSGPSVSLSGTSTPTASFTAPSLIRTTALVFQLTVTDNQGTSSSDQVTITVSAIPQ